MQLPCFVVLYPARPFLHKDVSRTNYKSLSYTYNIYVLTFSVNAFDDMTEIKFMREVWLVSGTNRIKAEDAVKQDDIVSRQSAKIKDASMYSTEKGFFIIIEGNEASVHRAGELLKEFGEKYKDKEKLLHQLDIEEEEANAGFGFIVGG